MAQFTIKQVDGSHEHTLNYLHREIFIAGESVPDFNEGYWWVVYDCDNLPIGFCGLVQSHNWANAGYLTRVGVLKVARGNGLQKRMLQVRENKARKLGWSFLVTNTVIDNCPSANSLISRGFRMFLPVNPWAGKDFIYWQKYIVKEKVGS